MMSPLAPIPSHSPSNSQSSSSCRSVEVVFPQVSQKQRSQKVHQHTEKARAISISSDEENAPAPIAIDEPSGSSLRRNARAARVGCARPPRRRLHNAQLADGLAVKEEEEAEEELHVIRFKNHLDSFKAPPTNSAPLRQRQWPTEEEAPSPIASSSGTRFRAASQPHPPLQDHNVKAEPSSQAFARESPIKVEAEGAGVRPPSLSTKPSSQDSSNVVRRRPKIEEDDSVEFIGSQRRRSHDEPLASGADGPVGTANARQTVTNDDSITFSATDADSSVESKSRAGRGRKKPNSDKTPSKPKRKAKAKTPKASHTAAASKASKTPRAAKSPKPTTEGSTKPKSEKVPKPLPVDVSSISNFVFSVLRTCPLCGPAHPFPPKQAPQTRRRHVSCCAFAKMLAAGDVKDILQQEMVRLEQMERLEFEQAEAAKTTFVRVIEESGLKIVNTRDDEVWTMLGIPRADPKRKISSITIADLAGEWGQGGSAGISRKKRRFGGPESRLKPHGKARHEIEQRAQELLNKSGGIQATSHSTHSTPIDIDEDTGDILTEMSEEIFAFPGDQRLAEERFTQALLPPASSFGSGSATDDGGIALPPATQMPSSTFASRSSSLLARRRPPVCGAGDGLFALFKRLEEKKQEWERQEEQRKIEEAIAQRRTDSLRRQREALAAAAAAAAAAEAAAEVDSVASQDDVADGDAGEGSSESWWEKRVRQMEELEREEQQEREEAERRQQRQEESWQSSYVQEEEGEGDGEARDALPSPAAPPSSGAWKPFNSYTFEHA